MISEIVLSAINKGGALTFIDPVHYPARYQTKIPLKVKMVQTVMSDLPFFLPEAKESDYPVAVGGNEYYVSVNSYGAVTAIFDDGRQLGLKPGEFEVIEFHPQ